jgi:hypothetical protein
MEEPEGPESPWIPWRSGYCQDGSSEGGRPLRSVEGARALRRFDHHGQLSERGDQPIAGQESLAAHRRIVRVFGEEGARSGGDPGEERAVARREEAVEAAAAQRVCAGIERTGVAARRSPRPARDDRHIRPGEITGGLREGTASSDARRVPTIATPARAVAALLCWPEDREIPRGRRITRTVARMSRRDMRGGYQRAGENVAAPIAAGALPHHRACVAEGELGQDLVVGRLDGCRGGGGGGQGLAGLAAIPSSRRRGASVMRRGFGVRSRPRGALVEDERWGGLAAGCEDRQQRPRLRSPRARMIGVVTEDHIARDARQRLRTRKRSTPRSAARKDARGAARRVWVASARLRLRAAAQVNRCGGHGPRCVAPASARARSAARRRPGQSAAANCSSARRNARRTRRIAGKASRSGGARLRWPG